MRGTIHVGTRGSALAIRQADIIINTFRRIMPDTQFKTVVIRSRGDEDRETELTGFANPGAFTNALEDALLDGKIDVAVHSMKDLPSQTAKGLEICCIPARGDVRDVLVTRPGLDVKQGEIPAGAVIGTDSPRRRAQLANAFPGVTFTGVRGNVNTRLEKVRAGQVDGIILARAGLQRLNLLEKLPQYTYDTDVMLPAAGQGAIGVECRAGDTALKRTFSAAADTIAMQCVTMERRVLRALNVGCGSPLACYCYPIDDDRLCMQVRYFPHYPKKLFDVVDVIQLGRKNNAEDLLTRVISLMKERFHVNNQIG